MSMVGMLFTPLPVPGEAHDHEAVASARNCAADVEQVVLGVDFRDAEILDRDLIAAHPAAHTHALHDARWERRGADRAGSAMEHRAVRGAASGEVMTLHHALEAFALRLPDDVDRVARLEDVDLHAVSDVRVAVVAKLDERPHRRDACFLEVCGRRAGDAAVGDLLHEADLDGVIAILLGCLFLYHEARSGLDDRARDQRAVVGEHLGHPPLLANYSFDCHVVHLGTLMRVRVCYFPNALISTSTPAGSSSFMS